MRSGNELESGGGQEKMALPSQVCQCAAREGYIYGNRGEERAEVAECPSRAVYQVQNLNPISSYSAQVLDRQGGAQAIGRYGELLEAQIVTENSMCLRP